MDPGLFIAIAAIVAVLGGGGAWLARNRALPWSPSSPRVLASPNNPASAPQPERTAASRRDGLAETQPTVPATRGEPTPPVVPVRSIAPIPVRQDDAERGADLAVRLERIETRLDGIARAVEQQGADLQREVGRSTTELVAKHAAEDARRDAALERFRADLLASMRDGGNQQRGDSARRAEISAELYARLARLEAALAAVTNPVLLPGEPYTLPAEFLPESLVWENWNEVGERAFALADALSAQRLYLSGGCRDELGTFVTSVRTLLTRAVYPNLQPEPSLAQQTALRAALEEIAAAIPLARASLEREFRGEGATDR